MKVLLLLFFTAFAATAAAQEFTPNLQPHIKGFIEKQKAQEKFSAPELNELPVLKPGEARKPGVYALPQDGMPCMVPYTADIVAIPNAFPKKELPRLGKIPNAAPQTGEQLRKNAQRFFAPPGR